MEHFSIAFLRCGVNTIEIKWSFINEIFELCVILRFIKFFVSILGCNLFYYSSQLGILNRFRYPNKFFISLYTGNFIKKYVCAVKIFSLSVCLMIVRGYLLQSLTRNYNISRTEA